MLGVPARKNEIFIGLSDEIADMVNSGLPDDHPVEIRRVPGRHDQAARIRIAADRRHHIGDLIDGAAVGRRP